MTHGVADPQDHVQPELDKGGAKFNRLEGCWDGDGDVFFNSTSGGDVEQRRRPAPTATAEGLGQVWAVRARGAVAEGTLALVYESPCRRQELDSPDNLCVTPRGGLILCEDDASGDGDTHPLAPGIENVNRLIGYSRKGEVFEFAVNRLNDSELSGVCLFSPSGRTMFFNLFGRARFDEPATEGMTSAVTGPWHRGPL